MTIVFFIIIIVIIVGVLIANTPMNTKPVPIDEETKERRRKLAEKFQREAEEADTKEKQLKEILESKYGTCLKILRFPFKYEKKYTPIRCFHDTIILQEKPFSYEEVLGCELRDETYTVTAGGVTKGESNTLNVIGRSLVGSIAGSTGAILGGISAGRKYTTSPSVSTIVHDYTIYINVNDIANPVIQYNIGENYNFAMELLGIIKIITQPKKQ